MFLSTGVPLQSAGCRADSSSVALNSTATPLAVMFIDGWPCSLAAPFR